MSLVDNTKYTTLLFRSAESRKLAAQPLALLTDDYYPVLSYPKAEMEGETAEDAAASFITLTFSQRWRMMLRRRIQPGDMFTYAPVSYMFADDFMNNHFRQYGHNTRRLQRRSNLWLGEFNHEEQLCKA